MPQEATFTDAEKQTMAALGGNLCGSIGTLPWQKIIQALLAACPQPGAAAPGLCGILTTLLPLFCPASATK